MLISSPLKSVPCTRLWLTTNFKIQTCFSMPWLLHSTHMDSLARWCGEVTSQARFRVEVSCGQTTRGQHTGAHSYVISLLCSQQELSHRSLPGHHGQDAECVPGKDWQLLSPRVLLLKCCRHHRQLASLHQQHKHQPRLRTPQAVQPGSPSLPLPLPQHQPQEEVS